MASIPPPQGLNEADYESIEAAVTETVRGRWFLSEFARRNRTSEMRVLLEAMSRLEASVTASQMALPTADPSVRLLIQRIKEVSGQLDTLVHDMRDAGVEDRFTDAVSHQARAVAGMMRGGPLPKPAPPPQVEPPQPARMPRADLPPSLAAPPAARSESFGAPARLEPPSRLEPPPAVAAPTPPPDPRLATLSGLDSLSLAEKLALFS